MSGIGVIVAMLSVVYSLFIVYARIVHRTPFSGWAPIMILLMAIGGTIMIMLGVIGEYL